PRMEPNLKPCPEPAVAMKTPEREGWKSRRKSLLEERLYMQLSKVGRWRAGSRPNHSRTNRSASSTNPWGVVRRAEAGASLGAGAGGAADLRPPRTGAARGPQDP